MSPLLYLLPGIALLSIFGKILSIWLGREPKGKGNMSSISEGLKSGAGWQIPLIAIGGVLLFFFNSIIYAVFAVSEFVLLFAKILKWIYDNLIRQTLVFIWKLFVNYGVKIPFTVLAATANSSGDVLKWDRYRKILKMSLILYLSAALLSFFIYAIDLGDFSIILFIIATLLGLAYTTGELAGNAENKGRKSMGYMTLYILGIGVLVGLVYALNLGDSQKDYGGFFTGLFYSPSLFALILIIVMLLLSVFIANAGAVYFAVESNETLAGTLRGVLVSLFQRSWYFIFQPIWTLLITAFLWIIPLLLLHYAASNLISKFVAPNLESKQSRILKKIKSESVINNLGAYLSPDSTEASYENAKKSIANEVELNEQLEQNIIYTNYLSAAIDFKSLPKPVVSNGELKQQKEEAKGKYEGVIKQLKETIKAESEQIKQMETNLIQIQSGATPDREREAQLIKNIKDRKTASVRMQGFADELKKVSNAHISYVEGVNTGYGLTYFIFLLSKFFFVALLMVIFWGVWASSSNRVYPMRKDSYLVAWVKEEKAANPYQPWAGWLAVPFFLYVVFSGGSGFFEKMIDGLSNLNSISVVKPSASSLSEEDLLQDNPIISEQDLNLSIPQPQVDSIAPIADPVSTEPATATDDLLSDQQTAAAQPVVKGQDYVVAETVCQIYSEPDTDSPKKGFIIYGENIKLLQNLNEMGYISYTNPKSGKTIYGYVLMRKINPSE